MPKRTLFTVVVVNGGQNTPPQSLYCNRYEQICAIKGALLPSCGFMVKTKQYVYMLRCTPVKGDYQFYIYCYQRKPFEKAQKEQQKNDRLAAKKRAEPER